MWVRMEMYSGNYSIYENLIEADACELHACIAAKDRVQAGRLENEK